MEGRVIGTDVLPEKRIEILQGMDSVHVQAVKPAFLRCPPEALDFGFGSPIPHLGVQEHGANAAADQRELVVYIGCAVVRTIPISG